jgi:biopolymer transport protein ExbB
MEWLKATVDCGIIGLLVVMSIISVSIAVDRVLVYRNIRLQVFVDVLDIINNLGFKRVAIATEKGGDRNRF